MDTQVLAVALNSMALEFKRQGRKMPPREQDILVGSMSEVAQELESRGVIVVARRVKMRAGASYDIPLVVGPFPADVTWVPEY